MLKYKAESLQRCLHRSALYFWNVNHFLLSLVLDAGLRQVMQSNESLFGLVGLFVLFWFGVDLVVFVQLSFCLLIFNF